jgi:glutathione reductase (NADPH)
MVEALVKHYNFLIIGAGSGAMGAGRRAAMFGQKVAMIENKKIGGTCVNVGCVPKKVMFNLANFIEDSHVISDYGVSGLENIKLNFPDFVRNRDAYIKRLNDIYSNNLKNANIDYITGTARFLSSREVEVNKGDENVERYTADHILIASGSTPEEGKFEGAEHCWSSDDVFAATELPQEIIVIGGGYIGVEMA